MTGDNTKSDDVEYRVTKKQALFGGDGTIYVVRDRRPDSFSRDYMSNRDPIPITYEIDETDARGIVAVLSDWLDERDDEDDDQ